MQSAEEFGWPHAAGVIADDGTFRIENVPEGRMRFHAGLSTDRYYLKSITVNGQDVTEGVLNVGRGERIDGAVVVISLAAGQLSGQVQAVSGAGSPVVILWPSAQPGARLIKVAHVNESGQFTIRGIMPGEYGIVAARNVPEGSERDERVWTALQPWACSAGGRTRAGRGLAGGRRSAVIVAPMSTTAIPETGGG